MKKHSIVPTLYCLKGFRGSGSLGTAVAAVVLGLVWVYLIPPPVLLNQFYRLCCIGVALELTHRVLEIPPDALILALVGPMFAAPPSLESVLAVQALGLVGVTLRPPWEKTEGVSVGVSVVNALLGAR